MTLRLQIVHATPGYPVRAEVLVKSPDGAHIDRRMIGDEGSDFFYIHSNQLLVIKEDGHAADDSVPLRAAQRAYSAYCAQARGVAYNGHPLPSWDALGGERQACWKAAMEAVL